MASISERTTERSPTATVLAILALCTRLMMCQSIGCIFLRDDQSIRCQNTSLQEIGESLHILTIVVNNKPRNIDIAYSADSTELAPIFNQINASIETVRIRRSNIQTIHKDAFAALADNLRDLDLSHNSLTTVPEALTVLWLLEHLNLRHNKIVFVRPSAIFDGLLRLKDINLANNYLGLADEKIDNLTLQYGYQLKGTLGLQDFSLGKAARSLEALNLSGNRLASVPLQITNLSFPELRQLDLSENVIGELNSLSSALLPRLEFLDVHANRIQNLPFYSLPLTLRFFDLTENPFHCSCMALWIYDWYSTNSTTIHLPTCNTPDEFRNMDLEAVPWSRHCQDDNSTFSIRYIDKGYRDHDVIQLVSSATVITVSWKVKLDNSSNKMWTVVYRKASDSPYQMTLGNPSQGKRRTNTAKEAVLTDRIQNLKPSTVYIVCIAVIQDGKYTIEPNKCQRAKTRNYQDVGEFEHQGDDKQFSSTQLAVNNIRTDLEDVTVSTQSITVKWRLTTLVQFNDNEDPASVRHEWTLRIRRTGSDNYTDIPVFDITKGSDTSDQLYEYSISDLASHTHYDVCLVDVDHRLLSEISGTLQTIDQQQINESSTCRTVVTTGYYILYVAEIVAIALACAICIIVVVVTIHLCRQKRLLTWKPKKLRDFIRAISRSERPQPIGCSNKYATATIPRAKCESKSAQKTSDKTVVGTWNTLRMPYKEFPQIDPTEFGYRTSTSYKDALTSVTIYSSGHSEC